MKQKKGQAWGYDLMIGVSILLFSVLTLYMYAINASPTTKETFDEMNYDANSIADNLLTEGYPENWDRDNVITLGITSKGNINQTKLERFYEISKEDYQKTRSLLNTKYNYYINFSEEMTINSIYLEGIGKPPQDVKNLIKTTRIVAYKNKPSIMTIKIWD